MNSQKYIVHICTRDSWKTTKEQGAYRTSSLEAEGFIHCSQPEQLLWVANNFYQDVPDLVLLWID